MRYYEQEMDLTEEQKAIIHHKSGCMLINAGAGCAKTTTCSLFVKEQIENGTFKEEEFCFITFTRFAADEIKTKLRKVMKRPTKVVTGTFHKTMFSFMKKANILMPQSDNLFSEVMDLKVAFFISEIEKGNPALTTILRSFKCVIVDEFQDLDGIQFHFLELWKWLNPTITMVAIGDLAQNIYRFRGTSNEFLRTMFQTRIDENVKKYKLTTNFRSTKAILRLVNALFAEEIQNNLILPMIAPAEAEEGMKPKYYEYAINPGKGLGEYEGMVAEILLPLIAHAKATGKSIVLIFPILKSPSYEMIMTFLRHHSMEQGYNFDIHQITKEDETSVTVNFKYDPRDPRSPVQCSTVHSSKGLEWDIVALINFSNDMFRVKPDEEDGEASFAEKTNLSYVALTRPIKELYIFANANSGGRHYHFERLGDSLKDYVDIELWGDAEYEDYERTSRPIGVKDLIRKLAQHPDLNLRIKTCSGNIKSYPFDGHPMYCEDIYDEMKQRNREMAFGTYIDWKIKQLICSGASRTMQEKLFELLQFYEKKRWKLCKKNALEEFSFREVSLDADFLNLDYMPNDVVEQYVCASRIIGLYNSRLFNMDPKMSNICYTVERNIMRAQLNKVKSIKDEYILSQTADFYARNRLSEIQAVTAPTNLYQGLPSRFDEFVEANLDELQDNVISTISRVGYKGEPIFGDYSLESENMIMGQADLVVPKTKNGIIVELKVSAATRGIDLRDSGNCKNLLQVLAYVALGRHGKIPLLVRWAILLNPLTQAHEIYDLNTWSLEDSREFLSVLEDLKARN
jgi:hypothetical protein